jgi:hypothetical protein
MADEAENGRADGGVFADKICRADIQSSVDIGITDLVLRYKKSNESPILKLLLSRLGELVARVLKKTR